MLFTKEYEENLSVCPRCDHHGRIGAEARFGLLLDAGYAVLPTPKVKEDPLKFRDSEEVLRPDESRAARQPEQDPAVDALTNALGSIGGHKAVLGVQDFAFMGGSMGMAVGAAFIAGVDRALKEKCAYVICTACGRRADAGGHSGADADAAQHRGDQPPARARACPISWC